MREKKTNYVISDQYKIQSTFGGLRIIFLQFVKQVDEPQ